MTHECLTTPDLFTWWMMMDFRIGFFTDTFIEFITSNGNSFYWKKMQSFDVWCIVGGANT